jgi:hypothetical protein
LTGKPLFLKMEGERMDSHSQTLQCAPAVALGARKDPGTEDDGFGITEAGEVFFYEAFTA